jgi:hypothetical protein
VFTFTYRVEGAGWATATIRDRDHRTSFSVGYLSDALGDLLEAVAEVAEDEHGSTCVWHGEPARYRWRFRRDGRDVVVEIVELRPGDDIDDPGIVRFSGRQPIAALTREVARAARAELDRLGPHRYRDEWVGHDFPTEGLDRLERVR